MPTKFIDRPSVAAALTIGFFLLITGVIFSWSFYSARSGQQTISVTGSAKTEARADMAKWSVEIYQSAFDSGLQGAYTKVATEANAVAAYFKSQNLASSTIETNTAVADQDWSYQNNGGPVRYRVHEEVTITSSDVEKVQALAKSNIFITRGYSVNPHQPEYYISNLPEVRITLLGQAIADAKARAAEIAKSGGSAVGKISSASSGVVQVLPPNSTNVEDYGQYDTSTIDKEVSVTARATFFVR